MDRIGIDRGEAAVAGEDLEHAAGVALPSDVRLLEAALELFPRRSRRERQLDVVEGDLEAPLDRLHPAPDHAFDRSGQFCAVSRGVLGLASGFRIAVARETRDEQGARARMILFQRLLGVPGVIAADLVMLAGESGVVARVAEDERAQLPVHPVDAEHRHVVIDRSLPVHPEAHPARRDHAPVDGKAGPAPPEAQAGRPLVPDRRLDDSRDLVDEQTAVALYRRLLLRSHPVGEDHVLAHDRRGVGV